ncbi:CrcB family protein [Streptosporangium sp. NPDC051023]|uniref:fluoride efflux transporter FluC n=1 Tax=Streptosporangium sp. NPDC051023 TaxID=3155410 RepID=UPI00344B2175
MKISRSELAAVACGGALGALARHLVHLAFPNPPHGFQWTLLWVSVSGCFLIGLVTVWNERHPGHPLVGPFVSTGFLGGFTTFSSYAVNVEQRFHYGQPGVATAHLILTPALAMLAVFAGTALARRTM